MKSSVRNFWPLDFDQEVEIYENPSWDMPGWNRPAKRMGKKVQSRSAGKDQRAK